MTQTPASRELPRRHEAMASTETLLNVGQMMPSLAEALDTAGEAIRVAPSELQEFSQMMQAHIAKGGKDIEQAAAQYMKDRGFDRRKTSLGFKIVSLLTIAGLALSACAAGANAATPDRPIQPTAVATQTIEQPSSTVEAPTQEPTAESTAEPTPDSPYGHWTAAEAVTVKADFTEEEILAALEKFEVRRFPAIINKDSGEYNFNCLVESISYLKEGHYIQIGDFDVRATAQCSYLDINGEKQTVTVALVVENRVQNTAWTPKFGIMNGTFAPSFIQEFFEKSEDIKPGSVISIVFGLPNEVNQNIETSTEGAVHHGKVMGQLHSEEEISAYTATGDPELFANPLILPFYAQVDGLYQFLQGN